MNVKEYVKIRQEQLKQFEAHWLEMQKDPANGYPENLHEYDWFDQERSYLEVVAEQNSNS